MTMQSDFNKRKYDEFEELLCDRVDIPEPPKRKMPVPNSVYDTVKKELGSIREQLAAARGQVRMLERYEIELSGWLDSVEMEDTDYE